MTPFHASGETSADRWPRWACVLLIVEVSVAIYLLLFKFFELIGGAL
jgi:hypothetical protein